MPNPPAIARVDPSTLIPLTSPEGEDITNLVPLPVPNEDITKLIPLPEPK